MTSRWFGSFTQPIKATRDFIRRPTMETFGGALLGGEKMNNEQFAAIAEKTPWNDESGVKKFTDSTTDSRDFKQGAGALGAILAAIYGGGAAMGGGSSGGAAGGSAGGAAAGSGTAAGSYGAGSYGTAAGYGGATAPAAYGGTTGAATSGGLLGTAGQYAKTGMQGMQAAQTAQNLFGNQSTPPPQMAPQSTMGPQAMASLVNTNQQGIDATTSSEMERRKRNQAIIDRMMGRNYG
jgi:hypothetical protein